MEVPKITPPDSINSAEFNPEKSILYREFSSKKPSGDHQEQVVTVQILHSDYQNEGITPNFRYLLSHMSTCSICGSVTAQNAMEIVKKGLKYKRKGILQEAINHGFIAPELGDEYVKFAMKYGDLEGLKWLLERGAPQKLDLERTYGLVYRGEEGMKKAFQDVIRKFDPEVFGSLGPEFVKFFCTQFGEDVENISID